MKERSDEELVRLHLAGDKRAFSQLVERYTPSVYNLAYRSTDDRMEAENIAQEALLRAYTALPGSRHDLPFRPWLFQITVNLCRNWAKKKRPLLFSQLQEAEEEGDSWSESIADEGLSALDLLLEEERRQALEEAVEALPVPYRQAIVLRYTEELSYKEMAKVLGLPLNTVRTHLFRAKKLLREKLAHWGTSEEADKEG